MIIGILLAAGAGRRFGAQKLLCPLSGGVPVAIEAGRRLSGAVDQTVAVVRPGEHRLAHLLAAQAGIEVSVCPNADQGIGTSLAWGVKACSEADGWVIALGDMPFIAAQTHRRVAEELAAGALLVAPMHRGRRGHPVGFASVFGKGLGELRGDHGARSLLRRNREHLRVFACPDPGILRDIDVPADLDTPC